ncbi:MAG: Bax inhibitor-1/YccA family protein [Phycisphaerae bacterium]
MGQASESPAVKAFVAKVFGWMSGGLLLTAIVALLTAQSQAALRVVSQWWIGLVIAEIVLVVVISWGINRIPATLATGLFVLYAGINGLTLSFIFLAYTSASISLTFFVTAGTFGAMALYGYTTKRDLTSWGSLGFMLLIGIIIASIANWFIASTMLYWIITYVGVFVFVALTAYDTQKIKSYVSGDGYEDAEYVQKAAVVGALDLYLDFVLLFIYLLRIFGRER